MKKLVLILAILAFGLTACQKDFDPIESPEEENQATMDDLKVGENFDWKTTKNVAIEVQGTKKNVIQVKSLQGDTYIKAMMNENKFSSRLTIPSYTDEVVLTYNGLTRNVPIVDNKISFNFN